MNSARLSDAYVEEFGAQELRDVATVVAHAHITAPDDACRQFARIGKHRAGLFRWMRIEEDLVRLFGPGRGRVVASFEQNPLSGGLFVILRAGASSLTLMHDRDPGAPVPRGRHAAARAADNHPGLFTQCAHEARPTRREYSAVLFHCRSRLGCPPAVIDVRFVDGQGREHEAPLDLLRVHPDLTTAEGIHMAYQMLDSPLSIAPLAGLEEVKDAAVPRLRTRRAE